MHLSQTLAVASFAVITCSAASANDGAASLSAGGIILRKEAHISMQKERLTIGVHKVAVEYDFLNESDKDIATQVAFPLPEYTSDFETVNAPPDFPDFRLWIEGQPVTPRTELQAIVKGINKAEILRRFGLDILHFGGYEKYLERAGEYQVLRLPEAAQRELLEAGMISGPDKKPTWIVRATHYWTMTFPAHKHVHVRHEYTPVAGQAQIPWDYFQSLTSQKGDGMYDRGVSIATALTRQACFNSSLEKTATRPLRQNMQLSTRDLSQWSGGLIVMDFVEYTLTTANTWKAPIKNFELIVDDTNPWDNKPFYVNFCWDGPVQRMDNHRLSAKRSNFVPKNELSIFFVRSPEPAAN
jgi:hypothetical protein